MSDDAFEVTVRVGDGAKTAGWAGRARVSGHELTWTAVVSPAGIGMDPVPVAPAKWDGLAWTLEDGTVIPVDDLAALMQSLGRALQAVTNGADAAAASAYEAAVTGAFGELPVQRILFL